MYLPKLPSLVPPQRGTLRETIEHYCHCPHEVTHCPVAQSQHVQQDGDCLQSVTLLSMTNPVRVYAYPTPAPHALVPITRHFFVPQVADCLLLSLHSVRLEVSATTLRTLLQLGVFFWLYFGQSDLYSHHFPPVPILPLSHFLNSHLPVKRGAIPGDTSNKQKAVCCWYWRLSACIITSVSIQMALQCCKQSSLSAKAGRLWNQIL